MGCAKYSNASLPGQGLQGIKLGQTLNSDNIPVAVMKALSDNEGGAEGSYPEIEPVSNQDVSNVSGLQRILQKDASNGETSLEIPVGLHSTSQI